MLNPIRGDEEHCSKDALTGFVGWMLQGILAGLAFTCLIAKRFREPPSVRRTWETWWYDTSKQGIGAIVIHLTNVYLAPFFKGDPCTWYVINFLLDSTIGLLIIFIGIRFCQFLAWYKKWPAINFGVYDAPKSWVYQTWIYIGLMAVVKIATTLFIQLEFWDSVKDLVLSPFSNETIELVLIMLVIPLFVNILIFWVTDNFLMRHDHQKKAHHGNEDNTDDDHVVIYDDRIALERCGIGMGASTSSIDSSSARRNHRNSFIVNP